MSVIPDELLPPPRDPVADALAVFLAKSEEVSPVRTARKTTLAAFRARYADDFLGFCDLLEVKPREVGAGAVPFKLTPIQAAYNEARTPRDVILKPRQVKITTIELARDVWFWLVKAGVGVIVLCQSSTEHKMLSELSERVGIFFVAIKKNAGLDIQAELAKDTTATWTLSSTNSVLSIVEAGASEKAAKKKGRGGTPHRVHTTELAFWEFAGETVTALLNAVAAPEHGTEIVHESTPNGAGGEERVDAKNATGGPLFFWYCLDARKGVGGYKFHFFSWLDSEEYQTALEPDETVSPEDQADPDKRIREEAIWKAAMTRFAELPEHEQLAQVQARLKWYRAQVLTSGQDSTDQEFPLDPDSCFLVSGRGLFDKGITTKLLAGACDPVGKMEIRRPGAQGTLKIWHLPKPGVRYVIPADTSEGVGGSASAAQVWEYGTGIHCATLWGQFKPEELAHDLDCLGCLFNDATVAVERNNHGHTTLYALDAVHHYPAIFTDLDEKPGWLNSPPKRTQAIDSLEQAHRTEVWVTQDRDILGEIRTFVVNKEGKAEAQRGAKDDLVLTAAIGWDVLKRLPPPIDYWSVTGGTSRSAAGPGRGSALTGTRGRSGGRR